jgi:hypothetical protein
VFRVFRVFSVALTDTFLPRCEQNRLEEGSISQEANDEFQLSGVLILFLGFLVFSRAQVLHTHSGHLPFWSFIDS